MDYVPHKISLLGCFTGMMLVFGKTDPRLRSKRPSRNGVDGRNSSTNGHLVEIPKLLVVSFINLSISLEILGDANASVHKVIA